MICDIVEFGSQFWSSHRIRSAGEYMIRNRKLCDAHRVASCSGLPSPPGSWASTGHEVVCWVGLCCVWLQLSERLDPRHRHLSASTHKPPVFGVVSCTRFRLRFSLVTGRLAPRFKISVLNVADVKHVIFERTLKYLRCCCAVLTVCSMISLVSSAKNTKPT